MGSATRWIAYVSITMLHDFSTFYPVYSLRCQVSFLEQRQKMAGMTKEYREALDKTLVCLTNDLEVAEALVYLQSKGILTENDRKEIEKSTTRIKKVTELVKRIKRKGDNSYFTLKEHLEDTLGSKHIAIEWTRI